MLLSRVALATVLAVAVAESASAQDVDPRIDHALAQVSAERLNEVVEKLASFGTRHTLSSQTDPTRGIGAAAQWIHDEFARASPRLQVRFDDHEIPAQGARIVRDVRIRNVVAVLPGRSSRRIYVSGHYDSLARAASASGGFDWAAGDLPAPGANDDGSGTALTMEAARVLAQSGIEFDATLVFVAFAGEEQGLVGAHLHAQKAVAEKAVIDAVFNNDIVGNSRGGNGIVDAESVRVFAEGPEDSLSRQLARYIQRMAARYVPSHRVRLIARHDRFGRGGDHTAFNQRGYAGVRFSEANENYGRQHVVEDTPDGVDAAYLARNTRVNLAGVGVTRPGAGGADHRQRARRSPARSEPVRLRRAAPVARVRGSGRLSRLLAGGVDTRLAVRAARGHRHRGRAAGCVDRRLRLRCRGNRSRRAREPGLGVRQPAPNARRDQGEVNQSAFVIRPSGIRIGQTCLARRSRRRRRVRAESAALPAGQVPRLRFSDSRRRPRIRACWWRWRRGPPVRPAGMDT